MVPVDDAHEAESLAMEMARAYRRMVTFYQDQLELSGPEADARARGADYTPEEAEADLVRTRDGPADQVSWYDLIRLAERHSSDAAVQWRRIREAARRELESGHRAAQSLAWDSRPWERARFLAIRESFRNGMLAHGIEAALIDAAAQAYSDFLEESEHLHMLSGVEMETERTRAERDGEWRPQRLSYAEMVEQSARRVERAHTRFLQSVEKLHEVRKLSPAVYVGHAGQVNVGHQQLNVARPATVPTDDEA
ncbi:MAG: hypothetical protein ACR2OU_17215 [Thermomicrobiales bacterium]